MGKARIDHHFARMRDGGVDVVRLWMFSHEDWQIAPNHHLGAGIAGHGTQYGFGGDEGNPFVHLQQSPYLDFTSAHPYPTEHWADLTLEETKKLIRAWIRDSPVTVGKPFFMGEFNVHNVDRAA
ncbi:glycoside hydrolase 5 family protein [Streptomyces microflavus]|uniref:hypothetical protein n=1 Tax=Streptomyces microflavus TaxID=1919 RepID=UPI0037F82A0A